MAKPRSYRLLCPIARALDKLGDRWTLLILRDLHAGPARFGELADGLPGLASNLLSARLEALRVDGLITHRSNVDGTMVYELTLEGRRSGSVLFELAAFGAQWPPPAQPRPPGHLRTVVVTLREALQRARRASALPSESLDLELVVDQEAFGIVVDQGKVDVQYGPRPEAPTAVRTDYESFVAAGDGRLPAEELAETGIELLRGDPAAIQTLFSMLERGFSQA